MLAEPGFPASFSLTMTEIHGIEVAEVITQILATHSPLPAGSTSQLENRRKSGEK